MPKLKSNTIEFNTQEKDELVQLNQNIIKYTRYLRDMQRVHKQKTGKKLNVFY